MTTAQLGCTISSELPSGSRNQNIGGTGSPMRCTSASTSTPSEESQCGWLKDRFGLSWQVVPAGLEQVLGDPDRERARRAMQAMLQMRKLNIAALREAADTVTTS